MNNILMELRSSDYDNLIDQALVVGDKQWFEELTNKKAMLRALEEEARRDLGFID